ncbi:hypothetical protein J6590_086236 [Homalodisca vitripennis]|nr:hypothetical protein J6590_086236 [Homalodisca vitripennis]
MVGVERRFPIQVGPQYPLVTVVLTATLLPEWTPFPSLCRRRPLPPYDQWILVPIPVLWYRNHTTLSSIIYADLYEEDALFMAPLIGLRQSEAALKGTTPS